MIAHLEHAHRDDTVQARPRLEDALDLHAAMGHAFGQLVGGQVRRRELPQPPERHPHDAASHCARNRTSPSMSNRMSGIAYRSRAIRSMPTPKANPV